MADASKSDINGGQTESFRFDSSKPMGKAVSNLPSRALDYQDLLVQLTFDESDKQSNLIDLWENIGEEI